MRRLRLFFDLFAAFIWLELILRLRGFTTITFSLSSVGSTLICLVFFNFINSNVSSLDTLYPGWIFKAWRLETLCFSLEYRASLNVLTNTSANGILGGATILLASVCSLLVDWKSGFHRPWNKIPNCYWHLYQVPQLFDEVTKEMMTLGRHRDLKGL